MLEAGIKRQPKLLPAHKVESPAIVAERLLRQVLPDDLYLHLTATGSFSCLINDHTYTFKREGKTRVVKDGKTYSCCIDLEDATSRPDQDRIVMEYLLALNDEGKYLSTANLTDITPPAGPSIEQLAAIINRTYERYIRNGYPGLLDEGVAGGLRGDTIRIRPPQFNIQPPPPPDRQGPVPIHLLVTECLRLFVNHQSIRGLRVGPAYNERAPSYPGHEITYTEVDGQEVAVRTVPSPPPNRPPQREPLRVEQRTAVEFNGDHDIMLMLVNDLAEQMAHEFTRLRSRLNVVGVTELPTHRYVDNAYWMRDPTSGFGMWLISYYNLPTNEWSYMLEMLVEVEPYPAITTGLDPAPSTAP